MSTFKLEYRDERRLLELLEKLREGRAYDADIVALVNTLINERIDDLRIMLKREELSELLDDLILSSEDINGVARSLRDEIEAFTFEER